MYMDAQDLLLADEIKEMECWDEMDCVALNFELCESFEPFSPVEQDEERTKSYSLSPIPASLQRELDAFKDYRACTALRFSTHATSPCSSSMTPHPHPPLRTQASRR